jgi:two-component system, cell cycle sensor histidine kinase and response regulator CckA
VRQAALRAKDLVAQIRRASLHEDVKAERLQLESIAMDTVRLLRGTLPRNISTRIDATQDLAPVLANSIQIHQVLLNLCVNAGQAMPQGGELRIAMANRTLIDFQDWCGNKFSGEFVAVTVQDTGVGIDPLDLARIFEPFYTAGKSGGTGLGLATVLSIVRQHGAAIAVSSERGKGTTFEVMFPVAEASADTSRRDRLGLSGI